MSVSVALTIVRPRGVRNFVMVLLTFVSGSIFVIIISEVKKLTVNFTLCVFNDFYLILFFSELRGLS